MILINLHSPSYDGIFVYQVFGCVKYIIILTSERFQARHATARLWEYRHTRRKLAIGIRFDIRVRVTIVLSRVIRPKSLLIYIYTK